MSIAWSSVDWGDVPTWLSAVTTLGALIAAGLVVRIEMKREDRAEKLLASQRASADRAEQADLVAAWYGRRPELGEVIHVRNGSPLPIYDVSASLHLSGEPMSKFTDVKPLIPPGENFLQYPTDLLGQNLGDGLGNTDSGAVGLDQYAINLHFRDSAGRSWVRHSDGWLEPANDAP